MPCDETTQLLNGNACCDDDGSAKNRNKASRLKDMLFGAVLAAAVAVLIFYQIQPHLKSSDEAEAKWKDDTKAAPPKEEEKSHLRPVQNSHQESHEEATTQSSKESKKLESSYKKFQAFGFQIYTGGKKTLL
jgi:uncharacterized protein HemX